MKKALLLTGLLLVLVAPLSMAATTGGVSLNWGVNCWGDGPQVSLMTFACASNTSPANWRMTASFKFDTDVPDFINWEEQIMGVSELGALPDWWLLSAPGTCRTTISNVFANSQAYLGSGADCLDPIGGVGTLIGGTNYVYFVPGVQVQIQAANTLLAGVPVVGGTENFISTIVIKNGKTVGTGACAGCSAGFVFGFYQFRTDPVASEGTIRLTTPYAGGNQCLTWQHSFTGQPCNTPVPARNTTWGQVKSLYR